MNYTEFKFLYPPRPENAVPPEGMLFYEKQKWIAQFKMNGTNTIIAISPEKEFITMTRHGECHKQWKISEHIKEELKKLFPELGWFVLCAEVLHSKTVTIKDTIFIHDCLVWNSQFLFKSTFEQRQKLLESKLKTNVETVSHYVVDYGNKIWFAKCFTKDFNKIFESISDPKIYEGLVLKNPRGKLEPCLKSSSNSSWSLKCRHPSAHYKF